MTTKMKLFLTKNGHHLNKINMYKVKFFYQHASNEPKMKEWFEDNPSIEIVSITQSSGMSSHDNLNTHITLVYIEKTKQQDTGPR